MIEEDDNKDNQANVDKGNVGNRDKNGQKKRNIIKILLELILFAITLAGGLDLAGLLTISEFDWILSGWLPNLLPIFCIIIPVFTFLFRLKSTSWIVVTTGYILYFIAIFIEKFWTKFENFAVHHVDRAAIFAALVITVFVYGLFALRCCVRIAYALVELAVGAIGLSIAYSKFIGHSDKGSVLALYMGILTSVYVVLRGLGNVEEHYKLQGSLPRPWSYFFYELPLKVAEEASKRLPNLSKLLNR